MRVTWEDRKGYGEIDGHTIVTKPVFSFSYAWILVTDQTAMYAPDHTDSSNQTLDATKTQEVMDFYTAWTPPTETLTPEETLENEKQLAFGRIMLERELAFQTGVEFDFGGTLDHIQARGEDRVNVMGIYTVAKQRLDASDDTTPTTFRAASDANYQLIPSQVVALGDTMMAGVEAIYQTSWNKKDQAQALVDGYTTGDDIVPIIDSLRAIAV